MIKPDLAHCYAIAGWGKDDLASSLIFVAVRCAAFGQGPFEVQLENAFSAFSVWTKNTRHRTTIKDFSKQTLKIQSPPVLTCLN